MTRVLVIVVSYNGTPWLERCLGSVYPGAKTCHFAPESLKTPCPGANTGQFAPDLYVWDNDSTDGSADYVAKHFPGAHLVRSAENVGFAKANNMGFQYALDHGYDYVYLLNQDAWLAPGALETLVAAAQAHPDFAVLSPLQYQDGYQAFDPQFAKLYHGSEEGMGSQTHGHPRPCPARADIPSGIIGGKSLPGREGPTAASSDALRDGRGREATVCEPIPSAEPVEVKRIMAAHWLMPVAALRAVGPFEEELFPLYGQDDDWCNRARYHGYKVGVVPEARAVHDRAQRQEPKEKVIRRNYYTGSLVRLCNVNRPLWERFLYVCLFTLVKALKYRSLLPLKYFRTLCGQISQIKTYRKSVRSHAKPE